LAQQSSVELVALTKSEERRQDAPHLPRLFAFRYVRQNFPRDPLQCLRALATVGQRRGSAPDFEKQAGESHEGNTSTTTKIKSNQTMGALSNKVHNAPRFCP
jgi:hypothetical protein